MYPILALKEAKKTSISTPYGVSLEILIHSLSGYGVAFPQAQQKILYYCMSSITA